LQVPTSHIVGKLPPGVPHDLSTCRHPHVINPDVTSGPTERVEVIPCTPLRTGLFAYEMTVGLQVTHIG
jgi:hypothetical protein